MISDRVDLYIQRVDLVGDDARLKTVLTQTPGVLEVRQLSDGPDSIARRVEVVFDPSQTNPITFHQVLSDAGFTVLSANELH